MIALFWMTPGLKTSLRNSTCEEEVRSPHFPQDKPGSVKDQPSACDVPVCEAGRAP